MWTQCRECREGNEKIFTWPWLGSHTGEAAEDNAHRVHCRPDERHIRGRDRREQRVHMVEKQAIRKAACGRARGTVAAKVPVRCGFHISFESQTEGVVRTR
jgi:pyridoxine 5'-phosphate synthase PdxJ